MYSSGFVYRSLRKMHFLLDLFPASPGAESSRSAVFLLVFSRLSKEMTFDQDIWL